MFDARAVWGAGNCEWTFRESDGKSGGIVLI